MRVLIVVDAQHDFIDGALGCAKARSIIPHMKERIKKYADGDTLILFTKNTHDENYGKTIEGHYLPIEHCIQETPGWSLVKDISSLADGYSNFLIFSDGEVVRSRVLKETFGSIKLCEILRQYENDITDITFMGFHTDTSIISNVLMARTYLPNTRIIVDASCCIGSTEEKHWAALEVMKSCYVKIIH